MTYVSGDSLIGGSTDGNDDDNDGFICISLVDFGSTSPWLLSSFSSVKRPPSDELSFIVPSVDRFIGRLTFGRRGRSLPK